MKAERYFKTVEGNKFYVKQIRGYYYIINRLDMSHEAMCIPTKEQADKMCAELNGLNVKH